MNHRPERLGSLIQEELNKIILKELEFNGILPTITRVEVTSKLDHAKVMVSVIPSEKADDALHIFKVARAHLQWLLMKQIRIHSMPRIEFVIDHGPERAAGIEKVLLNQ